MNKYELNDAVSNKVKLLKGINKFQAYTEVKNMLNEMKLTADEYQQGCKCAASLLKI